LGRGENWETLGAEGRAKQAGDCANCRPTASGNASNEAISAPGHKPSTNLIKKHGGKDTPVCPFAQKKKQHVREKNTRP